MTNTTTCKTYNVTSWGTGIRGLMKGLATIPQFNQVPLIVKDKDGRLPGELGVSKSMECDTFLLQCSDSVGWVTGRASSLYKVGCWW